MTGPITIMYVDGTCPQGRNTDNVALEIEKPGCLLPQKCLE